MRNDAGSEKKALPPGRIIVVKRISKQDEILALKKQIAFLIETFTDRDAQAQQTIRIQAEQNVVLCQTVAWFRGTHSGSNLGTEGGGQPQ